MSFCHMGAKSLYFFFRCWPCWKSALIRHDSSQESYDRGN